MPNSAQANMPFTAQSSKQSVAEVFKVAGKEANLSLNGAAEMKAIPQEFSLLQNYPNPFNPTSIIKFGLPKEVRLTLKVYNIQGQEVRTLVDGIETAGFKSVVWDGKNNAGQSVPSGVYLYHITAGEFVQTKRMILLK